MGTPEIRIIEKALPNKCSIGDVPVNKENLMDNASITRESATVWGKWKRSVNLLFTKSFNRLEHCTWHHFPNMSRAADDMSSNPVLVSHRTW